MFTISFKIRDLPSDDAVRAIVVRRCTAFALKWEALAKKKLSGEVLNVRTGALRSSVSHEVAEDGDSVTVKVFSSGVSDAAIHEYGGVTKPHDIVPTKAKALHFIMGGKDVFAKIVHHPGSRMPERSYIRSSLADLLDEGSLDRGLAGDLKRLFDQ